MKKKTTKISITLSPEILKKIKEGMYNRSLLINRLIEEYIKKTQNNLQ